MDDELLKDPALAATAKVELQKNIGLLNPDSYSQRKVILELWDRMKWLMLKENASTGQEKKGGGTVAQL